MNRSHINAVQRGFCVAIGALVAAGTIQAADPFLESGGMVVIEAENYHSKANTTHRDWYTFPTSSSTPKPDPDGQHATGAGGGKYVEILPDNRVTHDDPLQSGVNYCASGSGAPRMNYRVKINSAGRYYVRARAYSTGTEDNGVHFGVNNTWPLSGTAMQWCSGKNSWYWSGARRTDANHCGEHNKLYLDLAAGEQTIMVAMREDGFELDRFILTKDSSYMPSLTSVGPAESPRTTGGSTSNSAPSVNAGSDQTVEVDESANLRGSASDDGKPNSSLTIRWSKVSGPGTVTFGSASSLSTTARFSATGSYVLQLSAYDGELTSTDRVGITVVKDSGGSTPPPDPGDSSTGILAFAATANSANVARNSKTWTAVTLGGAQAFRALPDSGTRISSGYTSTSPYLRFNVNFPETGTYYVWLRGLANGNDNSAHVGLNGAAVSSAENITVPISGKWEWSSTVGGGRRATINITSTGSKTVEVYMREDGFGLERLLLTKSSSYVPSGAVSGGSSSGSGAFKQDSSGLVVMEAENHHSKAAKGSHSWNAVSKGGAQAMQATPDNGTRIDSNYTSNSPYLRFNVQFQKTGTHYVWLRGLCTGNDNSAHVGLGGAAVSSAANVTVPATGSWNWSGRNGSGQRITVNVSSTGVKTVEVYMREDGFSLDRVLITTSSSYSPSGSGPAQSPQ